MLWKRLALTVLAVAGAVWAISVLVRFFTSPPNLSVRGDPLLTFECGSCANRFRLKLSEFALQWKDVADFTADQQDKANCPKCGKRFSAHRVDSQTGGMMSYERAGESDGMP
jgi:hypothetical protein